MQRFVASVGRLEEMRLNDRTRKTDELNLAGIWDVT